MGTLAPLCEEILVRVQDGQQTVEEIAEVSDRPPNLVEEIATEVLDGRYISVQEGEVLALTERGELEARKSALT